jgi:MFS family permease
VYLIGVAIIAVLSPLFAVTVLLPVIISLRFLQGVGFSASSTSGSAMSVDLIPASRRAEGVGFYSLANTLGMAIGPNVGIATLQGLGPGWLFAASVASGVVSFAMGLFVRYEHRARIAAKVETEIEVGTLDPTGAEPIATEPVPAAPRAGLMSRLIEPRVLPVALMFLLVVLPYGALMAFIAAYGIEKGVAGIGLYFSVFAAANFVVRLGVGRLSDRYGVTVVLVPALLSMIAGLGVLWWADSLATFLVSAVVFGLGFGVALPLLQASAFHFVAPERRGTASATLFATADIAYGLGAMLLGLALAHLDHRMSFAGLAVVTVVALPTYLVVLRPRLRAIGQA